MVINYLSYVEARKAQEAAIHAERALEVLRREHLELVLSDLLAELEAA
jgi:hypothetical protein